MVEFHAFDLDSLAETLRRRRPTAGCGLFAFTSAEPGDGVTHVVRHSAWSLARGFDADVLVINTDDLAAMRGPDFSLQQSSLHVWKAGVGTGAILEPLDALGEILRQVRTWPGDYVLLDCPNLEIAAPLLSVAPECDGTVLVVSAGKTRRRSILRAAGKLREARVSLLGTVLNRRSPARPF